jgi:hypothetical protein
MTIAAISEVLGGKKALRKIETSSPATPFRYDERMFK